MPTLKGPKDDDRFINEEVLLPLMRLVITEPESIHVGHRVKSIPLIHSQRLQEVMATHMGTRMWGRSYYGAATTIRFSAVKRSLERTGSATQFGKSRETPIAQIALREGRRMRKGFTRRPKAEEPAANHGKNYITPGGIERLNEERHFLLTKDRPAVVQVVAWASGNGDRSENANYQYSKRRLRQIDGRVRFLTKRIEAAEVVDPEAPRAGQRATRVFFGATVCYANASGLERVVSIVGADKVDLARNHISWASPLGRALLRATEDDEVVLHAPSGTETLTVLDVRYERISVEPFQVLTGPTSRPSGWKR